MRPADLEKAADELLAGYMDEEDDYPILSPGRLEKITRREIPLSTIDTTLSDEDR